MKTTINMAYPTQLEIQQSLKKNTYVTQKLFHDPPNFPKTKREVMGLHINLYDNNTMIIIVVIQIYGYCVFFLNRLAVFKANKLQSYL